MEAKTEVPTKVGILLVETTSVDIARFVARELGWVDADVMSFEHIRYELRKHCNVFVDDVESSSSRHLIDTSLSNLRHQLVQKGLGIVLACTSQEIHGPFHCHYLSGQAESIMKVHDDYSVAVIKHRADHSEIKTLTDEFNKRKPLRQEFSRMSTALDAAGIHLTGETRGIIIQAWLKQNINVRL